LASVDSQPLLELTQFLRFHESLWRESAFRNPNLLWQPRLPELHDACLRLAESDLCALEQDPAKLIAWLSRFIPELPSVHHCFEPAPAKPRGFAIPETWLQGAPGRKLAQINAFSNVFSPQSDDLVDWCCGKGYLGRTLSRLHGCRSLGLEKNFNLCHAGYTTCSQQGLAMQFVATDVLHCAVQFAPQSHVVALHACGDLHRALVRQVSTQPVQAVSVVPCCYPLWLRGLFQPLSQLAAKSDLQLTRDDLHLAVQETVTAAPRETRQLHTLNGWRLGFDCLQRDIFGSDQYLTTPSLPKSVVQLDFQSMCLFLARRKGLEISTAIDWPKYERLGHERWQAVRRLQLVSHGFRRLLEIWLLHDLSACLQEAHYEVRVEVFCPRSVSPRNVIITAKR